MCVIYFFYTFYPGQRLALLLLRFPNFQHRHFLFFAQIFQQTAPIWKHKLTAYEKLFKNEPMAKHNWKYCSRDKHFVSEVLNPILSGNVDFGLDDEDIGLNVLMPQMKVEAEITVDQDKSRDVGTLDELTGELIVPAKRQKMDVKDISKVEAIKTESLEDEEEEVREEDENTDTNETVEEEKTFSWMPEIPSGMSIKAKVLKTFGTMQYYGYKRFILPELRTRFCIALLAVHVDTRTKRCKAKVVARHSKSGMSNPEREIMNVVQLLTHVFGMSQRAVYKWKEMVPRGEGYAYRKYMAKKERSSILAKKPEERNQLLQEAKRSFQQYEERLEHNRAVEIPAALNEWQQIEIVDDAHLDWKVVNNVSVLLNGDKPDNYMIKTLFNNECLEKFIAEAETCKTHTSQRLNHSQFCRTMIEVMSCVWYVH